MSTEPSRKSTKAGFIAPGKRAPQDLSDAEKEAAQKAGGLDILELLARWMKTTKPILEASPYVPYLKLFHLEFKAPGAITDPLIVSYPFPNLHPGQKSPQIQILSESIITEDKLTMETALAMAMLAKNNPAFKDGVELTGSDEDRVMLTLAAQKVGLTIKNPIQQEIPQQAINFCDDTFTEIFERPVLKTDKQNLPMPESFLEYKLIEHTEQVKNGAPADTKPPTQDTALQEWNEMPRAQQRQFTEQLDEFIKNYRANEAATAKAPATPAFNEAARNVLADETPATAKVFLDNAGISDTLYKELKKYVVEGQSASVKTIKSFFANAAEKPAKGQEKAKDAALSALKAEGIVELKGGRYHVLAQKDGTLTFAVPAAA